jgi:hypothetical protein
MDDGTIWSYGYNTRSEVTSGVRRWTSGAAVAGQSFGYQYDPIGNRVSTTRDGEGALTWTANNLNQYTQRDVPGVIHMMGRADAMATVTVAGVKAGTGTVTRQGAYFHSALPAANTSSSVWD